MGVAATRFAGKVLRNASFAGLAVLAGARCAWGAAPDATAPDNSPAIPAGAPAASPPDKSGFTLFDPTPDAELRSLSTDRPNKSTSPHTVDAGHFQVETDLFGGLEDGYDASRTRTREFFTADPVLKLGLTNFADIEVALGGYQNDQVKNRTTGSTANFDGFGDVTLRVKVNILGNDAGPVALAVEPFFKVPTATRGLGNGVGEFGLTIPLQVTLPYNVTALFVTEFDDFKNEDNTGRHAGYTNLLNLSYPVTQSFTVAAEVWSQVQSTDVPSQYTLDLSLAYQLGANTQFDVATYVGLNKAAPNLVAYAGISRRF